ncbi:hypothetical protein GOP47_0019387 [Adiantum capillus-veneris]|uniref:Uncharacterized protein n=1 Tax=Adiantum capillus-veneris TaxID=13818 RepID=A0A9D4UBQ9_ADICA|nr:hypothetical protein GOP47_0019387 [Adiantum capillus-veneris]
MAEKEIVVHLNEGSLEQDTTLGFVLLKVGGTYKDLRAKSSCDKIFCDDFVFLRGSKMIPLVPSQEHMWEVEVEEVKIQEKAKINACKRPRVESMGLRNYPPRLSSSNDPHIHHQIPSVGNDDIPLCEDAAITSHKMLKSTLAIAKEVRK